MLQDCCGRILVPGEVPLLVVHQLTHTLAPQTHRVNVQKLEAEQQAAAERASSKRKRDDADGSSDEEGAKRVREEEQSPGGLPPDFFADPAQAPAPRATSPPPTAGPSTTAAEDDPDWAEFEAYLASAPDPTLPSSSGPPPARQTASATISAAPVRYEFGAPVVEEEGAAADNADEEGEQEETEEERREREEREEREEMMARLEEEEREQREADEKVTVRVEAFFARAAGPHVRRACLADQHRSLYAGSQTTTRSHPRSATEEDQGVKQLHCDRLCLQAVPSSDVAMHMRLERRHQSLLESPAAFAPPYAESTRPFCPFFGDREGDAELRPIRSRKSGRGADHSSCHYESGHAKGSIERRESCRRPRVDLVRKRDSSVSLAHTRSSGSLTG